MELELVGDELPVLAMSWWCVLSVGTTLARKYTFKGAWLTNTPLLP